MKRIRSHADYYLVCFIILVYNTCYFRLNNMINSDEYESMIYPYFINGIKWGMSSGFHGFGHTFYLAPFLKWFGGIGKNYIIFQFNCLIVLMLVACFIIYFCKNYLCVNSKGSFMISLCCTCGVLNPANLYGVNALCEVPLSLVCCITMLILIRMRVNFGSKRLVYILFFDLLQAYSVTLHSRVLIILVCALVIVLIFFIEEKDWRYLLIGGVFPFFWCAKNLTNKVSDIVSSSYSAVRVNTVDSVASSGFMSFFTLNFTDWINVLGLFVSLIQSFAFISCGFALIFLIVNYIYIFKNIHKRGNLWYVCLFSSLCFVVMNFSISILCWGAIYGDYRWYMYLRYASPFAMLLTLSAMVACCMDKAIIKKAAVASLFLMLITGKWFIRNIGEKYDKDNYSLDKTLFGGVFYDNGSVAHYFTVFLLISFIVTALVIAFCKNGMNLTVITIIYLCISVPIFGSLFSFRMKKDIDNTALYNDSFEAIKEIDFSKVDKVYVYGSYWYKFYLESRVGMIQFINCEDVLPNDLNRAVLFTDEKVDVSNFEIIDLNGSGQYMLYTDEEILDTH